MTYKIYIHGRPQGQDIWPQCENANDSHYLNSFLDSGIGGKVDTVLQTDIWQGNAYYTYLRRKNVVEKIARGGSGSSYFAITVRFDKSICRNVNSLYNLLGLVYNKFCNDHFVKATNGTIQYLVNRFDERNDLLSQIHNIIGENLEKIIAPYIDTISSSKDTVGSNPIEYSLQDVDSPSFVEDMLQHKLAISADYSSLHSQVQPLKTQNVNLSTELDKWKGKATTLQQDKNDLQIQISGLKSDKEKLEQSLSSASEKAAKKYSSQLSAKEDELNQLRSNASKREEILQKVQAENERLRKENEDVIRNKEISDTFEQIKEPFIKIARLVASRFPENSENPNQGVNPTPGQGIFMDKIKAWLPLGTFVLVLLAFCFNLYNSFVTHPNNQDSSSLADSVRIKDSIIISLQQRLSSSSEETPIKNVLNESEINKIKEPFKTANIDIYGTMRNVNRKKCLIVNTEYTFRLGEWVGPQGGQKTFISSTANDVEFFVNNVKIDGTYTPNQAGSITIECKINGIVIKDRSVDVVE